MSSPAALRSQPVPPTDGRLAVFRADGGPAVGGGHLVRCQALASVLRERGWSVRFARRGMPDESPGETGDDVRLQGGVPEPAALRTALPDGCDLLVVDHYGWSVDFERACRGWARHILVIDDLADRRHDADLLLDMTHGRKPEEYTSLVPGSCIVLAGAQFAPLRPQYSRLRKSALAGRRERTGLDRILVACGYWDAADATSAAIAGLLQTSRRFAVDVVLGEGAPNLAIVEQTIAGAGLDARIHVGPENMAELIAAADLAIGAGGSSSWERCCLGLASLIVETADNQAMVASALNDAGAALQVGRIADRNSVVENIAGAVALLAAKPERLTQMSILAAAICDGRGARRTADAIAHLVDKPASPARPLTEMSLRPVRLADAGILFDWRIDPLTALMSLEPVPSWTDHVAWLEERLRHPEHSFYVAEIAGQAVGCVRVDGQEVSYTVAPERRGHGCATEMLKVVHRIHGPLNAFVKRDNPASAVAASKAGHRVVFIESETDA